MFKSYLIIAFRNIRKHFGYSIINISGLAIGMATLLAILHYAGFELSFDKYHLNYENIYRVESKFIKNGEVTADWATSSFGYATAMKTEFPEIENFARINLWDCERVVKYEDKTFREKNVYIADSSFLTIFTIPFTKGDRKYALCEPNTIVISESAAKKYFGEKDPIGRILELSNQQEPYYCMVTGVFEDVPKNSHLQFNFLISWSSVSQRWPGIDSFWYQHEAYTYVLLKPETDLQKLEDNFLKISEKYKTEDALKELTWGIELVPLINIHLNPLKSYEREIKGSRLAVYSLLGIGIIILIIAWINFVNLTTARSIERAKEIGMRKVVGANRPQLIIQFIFESLLLNICSILIAVLLFYFLSGWLKDQFNIENVSIFSNTKFLLVSFVLFLIGIFLSGIYPAFILTAEKPIKILKGKLVTSKRGQTVRKSLVIAQFTASVVLIISTFLVFKQIDFMREQSLGINIAEILIIQAPPKSNNYEQKIKTLKNELKKLPSVSNIAASSSVPGKEVAMFLSNKRAGGEQFENKPYEMLMVDYDFINTFGIEVIGGRDFSREFPTDLDGVILTEEAAKLFEFKDYQNAIGKEIYLEGSDKKRKILAVIKNYHQQSLKSKFKPIILFMSPDYNWIKKYYLSVKLRTNDINNNLKEVEQVWSSIFPSTSFDYFFLDDFFQAQYNADQKFGRVFGVFTLLAISIGCLGLLGLISLTTKQKTKEIGIRKVLGATTKNITISLSKELVVWIATANLIGWPVAWITMNSVLQEFAFRININSYLWIFIFSGFLTFFIAIGTVFGLTIKAAKANPLQSLKHE